MPTNVTARQERSEEPAPVEVWQLRAPCPRCEQRLLCPVACPICGHVAIVCAGERIVFPTYVALGAGSATDPRITSCPGCLGPRLQDFPPASLGQIRIAGIDALEIQPLELDRLIEASQNVQPSSLPARIRWERRLVGFLTVMNAIMSITLGVIGILTIVLWLRNC